MNCIMSNTDLKEQRQLHYEPTCQKIPRKEIQEIWGGDHRRSHRAKFSFMLRRAGRFLSSGSAWDRARVASGVV